MFLRKLAIAGLIVLLSSPPGFPQEGEETPGDGLPPQLETGLMTQVTLPPDQLQRNYQRRRSVPFKDATLAFSVVGHTDWLWAEAETRSKSAADYLVPLGEIYTPNWEPDRARIFIGYTMVPREINLEDWISVYAVKNGFRVLRTQFGTLYGKSVAEALVEHREEEERIAARLTVLRDGGRLLVLESRTKVAAFAKHAPTFAMAASSLRFEERPAVMGTESTEELVMSSPFRLTFQHPGSWTVEVEAGEPIGCQNAHLVNRSEEGQLAGYVTVRAFDRERFPQLTPKSMVQEFAKQLSERGLKLKPFPARGLPEADSKLFDRERLEAGFVRADVGTPIEAQVVVFSSAKLIVLAGMVTPGMDASEGMWLVNRQAFRMAVETMKTE